MSDEPTYLGLLNRVSLGETNAYCYLSEWAQVTDDPDVRRILLTVAAREGEHGLAFAKRINELGFELRPNPDDKTLEGKLEIVRSGCSDLEKMEALGFGKATEEGKPDVFDNFFSDHSIDIRTGELLGRYIAEERDSGRLLRGCYQCLREAAGTKAAVNGAGKQDAKTARATARRLTTIEAKVDQLCSAIEDLGKVVRADAMAN